MAAKGAMAANFQQTFAQAALNFPKKEQNAFLEPLSIPGVVLITE
jgi:hypothetical protein